MKRKTPPTNRAGTESLSFETAPNTTIIDLDNSDKDQSELTIKHSWVWNHFKVSPDSASAVCQVVRRGGIICATQLKRDKSGSTKNFHGHLLKIHQLAKPKLLKKTKKSSHIDMEKWSKSGGSKKIKSLFTTDAWTAPNVTAFMAVTAHYLDLNFKMKDLTLAVPHIQGAHTGKMFAHLFYDLLKKFGCIDKIHTITADNASTNNKMAQELSLQIQSFNPATHLLGCVAHVINLAAQAGIAALGTLDEAEEGEELSTNVMGASTPINEPAPQPTQNLMGINFMTTKPNGVNVNAESILKRIHSMCTYPELVNKNINCLEIDVATRWNSTFHMFCPAITLKESCIHYCQSQPETCRFLLTVDEWDQAKNVMSLLKPLSEATNMLCGSKFPTLNTALPVYMILMKHLHMARQGLYDQEQLINPAAQMIAKIDQ
ncbi:hypothetical protein PSHT_06211, partial [Puccinia striiformis]